MNISRNKVRETRRRGRNTMKTARKKKRSSTKEKQEIHRERTQQRERTTINKARKTNKHTYTNKVAFRVLSGCFPGGPRKPQNAPRNPPPRSLPPGGMPPRGLPPGSLSKRRPDTSARPGHDWTHTPAKRTTTRYRHPLKTTTTEHRHELQRPRSPRERPRKLMLPRSKAFE